MHYVIWSGLGISMRVFSDWKLDVITELTNFGIGLSNFTQYVVLIFQMLLISRLSQNTFK